ncbi:MAG: formamidopyrimidine-DNA glycosylase [Acidimicrobiia bacterium]
MPELPEVEVVRRDLDPLLTGRTIARIDVNRDRSVRREPSAAAFAAAVTGRVVTSIGRVGKFLVVHLAPPGEAVVVHLGMSGQWRVADPGTPRPAHTHVVWSLDDGREVRFVDPRTFGQMFRSPVRPADGASGPLGVSRPEALVHLGPDALTELTREAFAAATAGRRVVLKRRLMDQTALAGLGNIYSDEILFRAAVAGSRPAGSLDASEIEHLVVACERVLTEAIAARGSTLSDEQFVDGHGRPGRYQEQHAVHARAGLPCRRCATLVVRERYGARSGYRCPSCQPLPSLRS